VYLPDSWVLSVHTDTDFVRSLIDAVLEHGHPMFDWPPHSGEQNPYATMRWQISGEVHWNEGPNLDKPAIDANGQRDFGNIDAWWSEGEFTFLEGDWGSVRIRDVVHMVDLRPHRAGLLLRVKTVGDKTMGSDASPRFCRLRGSFALGGR
jgi:hypothetical protein